jgi:DNA transformation protein and related proteins
MGLKKLDGVAWPKLRGLGPASIRMFQQAGIDSARELRAMGSVAAYMRVRGVVPNVSLNLLYAIEGALTDRDWREVAKTDRLSLALQCEDWLRANDE